MAKICLQQQMHRFVVQFDTDLVALRQQSGPFYLRWQFWWTAVPLLLTLALASTAIALRVTSPNAVIFLSLLLLKLALCVQLPSVC